MTKKKKKRASLTPQQVIDRFVWRARRVEAHSLVKNGDAERHARRRETYDMTSEGVTLASYNVPDDEEAVESLAGRLRPFIVQSEPIYLTKVFAALASLVSAESFSKEEKACLASIESWFDDHSVNKDKYMYTIQVLDKDGKPQTQRISDAVLAESWLYTDYVHADPRDEKAEGLKVDYIVRYRAASPYFCEFALQVVSLLNLIRGLAERRLVSVSEYALRSPVTYEAALAVARERGVSGSMYILPPEADSPTDTNWGEMPNAINVSSLATGETRRDKAAHFAVFSAERKLTGIYPVQYEASGENLTIVIANLLKLTVRTNLGFPGRVVEAPFEAEAIGEAADRAQVIAKSLQYPNYAVFTYTEEGEQHRLRIRQPKDAPMHDQGHPRGGEK